VGLGYNQKTQYVFYSTVFIPITMLVISYINLAFLDSNHILYCVSKINLLSVDQAIGDTVTSLLNALYDDGLNDKNYFCQKEILCLPERKITPYNDAHSQLTIFRKVPVQNILNFMHNIIR